MTGTTENQQAARRSDATRTTILTAARERFAADGYEKATIRAIARDAKIDPSMVMRYYGNKAGLFAAAVAIDPGLPGLSLAPRGPEQAPARAALCASAVLGLALTRYVLRFPASVALGREEIVDWLGPTVQRYLTAPTP